MNSNSPIVSCQWLNENIDLNNLFILDASINKVGATHQNESVKEYITGAIHFDLKKDFADRENPIPNMIANEDQFTEAAKRLGIKKDSIIVVYDDIGIYSSPRVRWMLRAMGHQNVRVLDGGLAEYKKQGFPTSPQKTEPQEGGDFVAHFDLQSVVTKNDVFSEINIENCLTIDARSSGRFCGDIPEPRAGLRGGHIPNSINIPFASLMYENVFKSKEELQQIFSPYLDGSIKLRFTCGSGITACVVGLAAEICGIENYAIYDGSWSEWGIPSNLPVSN